MSVFVRGFLADNGFLEVEDNTFEHENGLFVTIYGDKWQMEDLNDIWTKTGNVGETTELVETVEYFVSLNGGI